MCRLFVIIKVVALVTLSFQLACFRFHKQMVLPFERKFRSFVFIQRIKRFDSKDFVSSISKSNLVSLVAKTFSKLQGNLELTDIFWWLSKYRQVMSS